MAAWGMKWNAIHHDLHLSVLAGVGGVLAVVLATPHPATHRILHLGDGGGEGRGDWKRDDAKEEKSAKELFHLFSFKAWRVQLARWGTFFARCGGGERNCTARWSENSPSETSLNSARSAGEKRTSCEGPAAHIGTLSAFLPQNKMEKSSGLLHL